MYDHIPTTLATVSAPACGDGSRLDIQARTWVCLTEDDADPDAAHGIAHYEAEAAYFFCTRCAASGWIRLDDHEIAGAQVCVVGETGEADGGDGPATAVLIEIQIARALVVENAVAGVEARGAADRLERRR